MEGLTLKDIKISKGMKREYVNNLIKEHLILEDEKYLGSEYIHNWKCKYGNTFKRN